MSMHEVLVPAFFGVYSIPPKRLNRKRCLPSEEKISERKYIYIIHFMTSRVMKMYCYLLYENNRKDICFLLNKYTSMTKKKIVIFQNVYVNKVKA